MYTIGEYVYQNTLHTTCVTYNTLRLQDTKLLRCKVQAVSRQAHCTATPPPRALVGTGWEQAKDNGVVGTCVKSQEQTPPINDCSGIIRSTGRIGKYRGSVLPHRQVYPPSVRRTGPDQRRELQFMWLIFFSVCAQSPAKGYTRSSAAVSEAGG